MSVEANVKPELLIWARKSAGFDMPLAAKKMNIKPEKLQSWENGTAKPTVIQLRHLAEIYKRPIAVFYLASAPKGVEVLHDFRLLPKGKPPYSPELLYEIRHAQNRRKIALELFESLSMEARNLSVKAESSEPPVTVAARIRNFLNISIEEQLSLKNHYDALGYWKDAIESKDILVFQASGIPVDDMRGFSISTQPLPVIVLNIKDSPFARIFTLIHELTHILIGREGICDLHEDKAGIEVYCNAVAGLTLVPDSWLHQQPEVIRHREKTVAWSDIEIKDLANRVKVSRQVILRRLLTLGLISDSIYQQKHGLYTEQALQAAKTESGFAPPSTMAVATSGNLFSRLVLSGYHQEKITGSDVSDYLSVRLKHLPKIETAVLGR